MPAEELLIAIAQVAVAIAGFSGLIAAIRTAAPEGWHPRDIWSLSWMLGASVGALVLALLPPWLALFALPASTVYRAACAVGCVYVGVFLAVMVARGRALTRRGHPPRVRYFPGAIAVLLGIATLALAAGAAGLLGRGLVATYVGGLVALLVASVSVLAVFLILLARLAQNRP